MCHQLLSNHRKALYPHVKHPRLPGPRQRSPIGIGGVVCQMARQKNAAAGKIPVRQRNTGCR